MALNKASVIERSYAYLRELHVKDPVRCPATVKAIADHLEIARGTLYNWVKKGDSDAIKLVKAIEDADVAMRGAPVALALEAEDTPAAEQATTAELEREMLEALKSIAWMMKTVVSMVDHMDVRAEAPAVVKQVEATLGQLNAIAGDLAVPYNLWYERKKHERGTATEQEPPTADPVLDLDFNPETE